MRTIEKSTHGWFTIARKMNPEGMIFSNVGADVPVEKALEAVELLEAQALRIHVNSPQELVMPEGNREFVDWLDNIASLYHGACSSHYKRSWIWYEQRINA